VNVLLAAILTCIAGGALAIGMLLSARCVGKPAGGMPYALAIALGTACAVAATRH
jgi:hypothetical protein